MHIPDGYLGPYTYIAFWIIMFPIWYYAGKRLSAELKSRQVPLSGAVSSVLLCYNDVQYPDSRRQHRPCRGRRNYRHSPGPLGGSDCHHCGTSIAGMMFGDGGITAIAANCFNMAVVIPFVGYYIYKLVSNGTEITSREG